MVHIISKRDGPRREDAALKHVLDENRGTIEGLKRALTGGAVPARRRGIEAPSAEAVRAFGYRRPTGEADKAAPYVRISPNGRVVIADYETGRQLHHLGDLRGSGQARHLVLATRENGYFAPLDPEICAPLRALDGASIPDADAEDDLAQKVGAALGLVS